MNLFNVKKRILTCLCLLLAFSMMYAMAPQVVYAGKGDSDSQESSGKSNDNPAGDEEKAKQKEEDKKKVDDLKKSISEKEGQLSDLEKEKKSIAAGKSNVQKIINGLKASKNELSNYVAELDNELESIQANIATYNQLVEDKSNQIEETEAELNEAIATEEAQYEAMKKRIQFMYESGDSMYLELIISAESFGDMLNKADYIEQLEEYDRGKLEEYTLTVQYTDQCKKELESEKEILEEAKKAAEEEEENMNNLIDEKKNQIEIYESDIANQEEAIREYDAELAAQTSLIEAVEAALAAEKAALTEATSRTYDGGMFAWPAPSYTRISSEYGTRMHPTLKVEKFHNGLDMAAPAGSPILAAYDGEVVAAGYSSSMGNYIMIDHGSTLYTIYMHASALYVSKGDTVSKSQKIAAVGTTGRSTGNHLHFGVRYNGNYVNPYNYL